MKKISLSVVVRKIFIIISIIALIPLLLFFVFQILFLIPFVHRPYIDNYETDEKEAKENDFYSTVDNTTNLKDINISYVPLDRISIEPVLRKYLTSVGSPPFRWEDYEDCSVFLRYSNNFFYCVAPVVFESGENGYVFHFYKGVSENTYNGAFIEPDALSYIASWPSVKRLNKIMFLPVVNGVTTFDTIKKIDPAIYLYDNKDETASSFHRFFDGTVMCIDYEQKGSKLIVTSHGVLKDAINFADILLPIDLKLIK